MDLIDRQALLQYIEDCKLNYCGSRWDLTIHDEMCDFAHNAVADAPTIEPKRGEWERHPDFLHIRSANIHRCSLCKERPLYRMGNEVLSAFCPNCGADMRGEEDD